MKHVMLICTSGLTSRVLLTQLMKVIFSFELDINVESVSIHQVKEKLVEKKYDALLLSPQVRYFKKELEEAQGIPVDVISMKDYGLMDAESIIVHLQSLLNQS